MPDLDGKRFLITGLSRLTVRVAALLTGRGGSVTVIAPGAADGEARDRAWLTGRLPPGVQVLPGDDLEESMGGAHLTGAECLLALADDDLENLAAAVICHALDPAVPIVLRAYDITLADQLEEGLNVRRAFSVSVLSAPAFLAAALGAEVVETLRLGDTQVPIWEMTTLGDPHGTGSAPADAASANGTQVLATGLAAGDGLASTDDAAPRGNRAVVGGPLRSVVALALSGSGLFSPRAGASKRARPSRRERRAARPSSGSIAGGTLLPITAAALVLVLITTIVVFGVTLHKNPVDALYFAVSTALGNSTLDSTRNEWLKGFGVMAMIAGGALLGVVFSFFAAVATTTRLEQRAGRQAQRMSGHAVVAGLGTVGYRVGRLLHDSGIPWAGLDRAPDPRYAEAAGANAPVLTGDVRLPENLERAGIGDAACLFACTDNDLANIEACLQARRLNPGIRTVARIFDDVLASRVAGTFGVDAAVSATRVAAAAFVGAATDEHALRTFAVAGAPYAAFRMDVEPALSTDRLRALRMDGVSILATRNSDGTVEPGGVDDAIAAGTTVIVAGPRAAVEATLLHPAGAPAAPSVSLDQGS